MSNQIILMTRPNNQFLDSKTTLLDEEQLEKEEQSFEEELRNKLFNSDQSNTMGATEIKDEEDEDDGLQFYHQFNFQEIEEMDDYPDEIQQIQEES